MAFTVPPSKNYVSPLTAVPLKWSKPPVEGPKAIQCSITWDVAEAGANNAVLVNVQDNAPLNFSQICGMIFDNSQNGSDVNVIFPDTETTFSIPAYTPYAVLDVFTNGTSFYIQSPNALSTDKTSFMILNTPPPPVAVPTTQEQNVSAVGPVDVSATGSEQLVKAGMNGTLEGAFISASVGNADESGTGGFSFELADGEGQIIAQGEIRASLALVPYVVLFQASDLRVRFQNGLIFSWVSTNLVKAFASPNLYYRTP